VITANFIHRTFRICCGRATGTAFTIDVDGREYLVTARHVLAVQSRVTEINVFSGDGWMPVPVQLVGHGAGDIDISVLATDRLLTPPGLPVQTSSDGAVYGQEMYFLGFPYQILGTMRFTERQFPLPFVKRAILSCLDGDKYFLDGHNNPGFSGGPVVFAPQPASIPTNIAAVISGYLNESQPVLAAGVETGLTYNHNTGIIVSYDIKHAISLARAHPIGICSVRAAAEKPGPEVAPIPSS
jgi:Trypsin-like peptidase domain